ncbi:MAG TPA: hypothetical protein VJ921_06075 [Vicinamibacteria bacterium]|nr:hypothetical protein [Vicinamibacteria bacterium]
MENFLRPETSAEYFKELVERAMARQKVSSSELSSYYLVQLLENFVAFDQRYAEMDVDKDTPLAELLCQALASHGVRRFHLLKFTGDVALFMSGFFSDSVTRRLNELDYYVRLGGYAYGGAARLSALEAAALFEELAHKFVRFVDVLNEVSEESAITENAGILRLYEKWRQTGSRRSEALLRREGILLGDGSRRLH